MFGFSLGNHILDAVFNDLGGKPSKKKSTFYTFPFLQLH
jgi:hypothetical protein